MSSHDGQQVVDEDDVCPICQLVLYDPVVTDCRHTFCRFCMATWASASASLEQPMLIMEVEEEPVEPGPNVEFLARCPMCRALSAVTPSTSRHDELKKKYPRAIAERQDESDTLSGSDIHSITIDIGNSPNQEAEENSPHFWTYFVRPSRTDIFEEVWTIMYSASDPIPVTPIQQDSHFHQASGQSWGSLPIEVVLVLKDGLSWISDNGQNSSTLILTWTLDFQSFGGRGAMVRYREEFIQVQEQDDYSREGNDREEAWARG